MRFTAAAARELALNPTGLAASLAVAPPRQSFGNPQRSWLEGAWRTYFQGGRDVDAFRNDLEARIRRSTAKNRAELAPGARSIAQQFTVWEAGEAAAPVDWFPPAPDVDWSGHYLAIAMNLVYLDPEGYRLRYLWTDRASNVDATDARLFATAAWIYGCGVLGANRVRAVEIWQLRQRRRKTWMEAELLEAVPDLVARVRWLEGELLTR